LLERGFATNTLSWLRPSLGNVENLAPVDASPPNLRDEMCSGKHHKPASDEDDIVASNTGEPGATDSNPMFYTMGLQSPIPAASLAAAAEPAEPVVVYTGPTRTGAALLAAIAADADSQNHKARGRKSRVAEVKPDAAREHKGDTRAKNAKSQVGKSDTGQKPATKPAGVKHANATTADVSTKPASKPAAAASSAAKPARPKPVAAKPKPAPKNSSSDGKPAG
jgi:D-alanyl-D-alanine carboxypeptidase